MTDLRERILSYLNAHTTLNLATAGPEGPWAAAVLYVQDDLHLYFTSVAATRHGRAVESTGRAAGTINDDCTDWMSMKGIQLEGEVAPVEDPAERAKVVAAYLRRFPFAAALWDGETDAARIAADPGVHGFYRLTPTRVLFTDNQHHPQGREELPR
jgi:uncharacterized protein YhbP (UPF0306 family)